MLITPSSDIHQAATADTRAPQLVLPVRVQLSREKGWRMPANTKKVDRTTKWGNIFVVGKDNPLLPGRIVEDRRHARNLYAAHAPLQTALVAQARAELAGVNLACWCPLPVDPYDIDCCHASVLIGIANGVWDRYTA